jgi:hypothetical protein
MCQEAHKKMVVGLLKFDYLRIDLKPPNAAFIKSICSERLGKSESKSGEV